MSWFKKIMKISGNTLYYPGCLTKFVAVEVFDAYQELLKLSGQDFIMLSDQEVCCGSPVLNAGFADDFNNLAKKNLALFKSYGINKIITGCPACYDMFNTKYQEILGEEWDIEVEHMTTFLLKRIRSGKLKLPKLNIKATYHDPCHLGRYEGIYEEPREILKELGVDLREMVLNREHAFCCGAGGGVHSNNRQLAQTIANERVSQAIATDADYIITPCSMCTYNLRDGAQDKMKVIEFAQAILGRF